MFTDKEVDAECIRKILVPYMEPIGIKQKISRALPDGMKTKIKKMIKGD